MKLGEAVRALRERRGLTATELAVRIGVDVGNMSRIERQDQGVYKRLDKIAEALGVAPIDLLLHAAGVSMLDKELEAKTLSLLGGTGSEAREIYKNNAEGVVIMPESSDIYVLRVDSTEYYPVYQQGHFILVNRLIAPKPDDVAILYLHSGGIIIRRVASIQPDMLLTDSVTGAIDRRAHCSEDIDRIHLVQGALHRSLEV